MNRISLQTEQQFLTTIIMCGPPPPKPNAYSLNDGEPVPTQQLGHEGFAIRDAWLDEVTQLCKDRFEQTHPNIGEFITMLDTWWQVNEEEANDGIQSKTAC